MMFLCVTDNRKLWRKISRLSCLTYNYTCFLLSALPGYLKKSSSPWIPAYAIESLLFKLERCEPVPEKHDN